MFENEEFIIRIKKDYGIVIYLLFMFVVDDEKKLGEVRDVNFLYLYV